MVRTAALALADITPTASAAGKTKPRRRLMPDPSARQCLVPKNAQLNIGDPKVGAIVTELKNLKVDQFPHASSVLFRVFLELSTDHFMTSNALSLTVVRNARTIDKTLRTKVQDVVNYLVSGGAKKKDFQGIQRALNDKQSPLSIDLLHGYVHNQFVIPKTRDLLASWDEARPYFERIWA